MMKISIDYDLKFLLENVLRPIFKEHNLDCELRSLGELVVRGNPEPKVLEKISDALTEKGIHVISDHKHALVQNIKKAITTYLSEENIEKAPKLSTYLAETCNYSYAHLSSIFSEITYTSIENFVILKKIELAKKYLNSGNSTLTEIAHRLGYSSVAHLSNQFKNTTGLSPTLYREIIRRKKEIEQTPAQNHIHIKNEH